MERGGDWWSEWVEAWGWTAPAGGSGHHARLFQRLSFLIAHNEVVGDKDVERGAAIFCKIITVCFLSVRYRSDGLYYKMAGTPSSPTRFSIRVEMISLLTTKVKWNLSMLYK